MDASSGAAPDHVWRVLLVDDQQLWRQVVGMQLSTEDDLQVVGEAADAGQALACATALQPDLVVLDLDLGNDNGRDLLGPLRVAAPGAQVLVLSGTEEVDDVVAAFGAGAVGFLPKDHPPEQFADALRTVANGRPVLPPAAVGAVMEEFRRQASQVHVPVAAPVLSDRELEVSSRVEAVSRALGSGLITPLEE